MTSVYAAPPLTLSFKRKTITNTAAPERGCLLVYPNSKKAKQRVAVGDGTGIFKVFSIGKRLEPVVAFETTETAVKQGDAGSGKLMKAITAATLFSDQLFYIRGSVLHAYSRKGKPFFTVDTNVTEKVHSLAIDTPYIFLAGDFMVTTMKETKELGFYLSPDRVNGMCVYVTPDAERRGGEVQLEDYVCCLACNDRVLRLVRANKLGEEIHCEAALTTVVYHKSTKLLFYGTQSGSIGVMVAREGGGLRKVGAHMPRGSGSSIVCLGLADVNADGQEELLVGCDDGALRVVTVKQCRSHDASIETVQLADVWVGNVGERVMAVAGGAITLSLSQPDVLVHTFSGQVVAFTLDEGDAKEEAQTTAKQESLLAKQQDTQREVEELRKLIAQRTSELMRAPVPLEVAQKGPAPALSANFKLSVSLAPVEGTPMLSLVISADAPLEGAFVQSSMPLSFVSTEVSLVKTRGSGDVGGGGKGESNSLRVPLSSARGSTGAEGTASPLPIATITPVQRGGKRLEVQLWADESVADTLRITAFSAQPPRTAQVKFVPLCALPLYERVSSSDTAVLTSEVSTSMSHLVVNGNFRRVDIMGWLGQLLPAMADSSRWVDDHHRFIFTSACLHSVLTVDVEDGADSDEGGRAVFACNSLVTLAAVKRHIVKACAEAGFRIKTREHILCLTALRHLQQLYPIMSSLAGSQRRLQQLRGLCELQGSETDLTFLPRDFQEVLASAEEVECEAEVESQHEVYVKRAIAALYRSFVYFKAHAPPLSETMLKDLEAASCGVGFNPTALERMMFPGRVSLQEAAAAELAAAFPSGSNASGMKSATLADAFDEHAASGQPLGKDASGILSSKVSSLTPSEHTANGDAPT